MNATQDVFDGLAFPVARVRYSNGNYNATIRRDSERTFRARVSYDPGVGGGARGARPAALKAMERALTDFDYGAGHNLSDYVAIPGDLDATAYVFTFVPKYCLAFSPDA